MKTLAYILAFWVATLVASVFCVSGTLGVARAVALGFGETNTTVGVVKAAVNVAEFDTRVLPRSSVAMASTV